MNETSLIYPLSISLNPDYEKKRITKSFEIKKNLKKKKKKYKVKRNDIHQSTYICIYIYRYTYTSIHVNQGKNTTSTRK